MNLLHNILNKELVGLYSNDGKATVRNLSGPEIKKKMKAIIKIFKECGLNIAIQTTDCLTIFYYLDVENI